MNLQCLQRVGNIIYFRRVCLLYVSFQKLNKFIIVGFVTHVLRFKLFPKRLGFLHFQQFKQLQKNE